METRQKKRSLGRMRLAVIATPRTGNTWLKVLLGRLYTLPEIASFSFRDTIWSQVPERCILQIHERGEPAIQERFKQEGFRILTLTRHPFDVLISILRFTVFANTSNWLHGAGGDESSILGISPNSDAVLAYARGLRAEQLFGVSADWKRAPGVYTVRYEDLVANPAQELQKVIDWFGPADGDSIDEAVAEITLEHMKICSADNHVWIGRPGLWRELIAPKRALELAEAMKSVFDEYGYTVDPDPDLTAERADQRWAEYFGKEVAGTIAGKLLLHQEQLEVARQKNVLLHDVLTEAREELGKLSAFVETRLHAVTHLGRFAFQIAYATQYVMDRLPRLARVGKLLRGWFDRNTLARSRRAGSSV